MRFLIVPLILFVEVSAFFPMQTCVHYSFLRASLEKKTLENLRQDAGSPSFLKEKWKELAIDGLDHLKKVDSSVTGPSSHFFDGLSHFFASFDFLTVFFSENKEKCFSNIDGRELKAFLGKNYTAWVDELTNLKERLIDLEFQNETISVPLYKIWGRIKHRGVVVTQSENPEILKVDQVKVNKTQILDYMEEGIKIVQAAPVELVPLD